MAQNRKARRQPAARAAAPGKKTVVTPKELEAIQKAMTKVNAIGREFEVARNELKTIGELVGDRYGIDLLSGRYNIEPNGVIVEVGEPPKPGAQLLNE